MKKHEIITHIIVWIRNYANKAGVNGFTLGLSGGIDSALVSTLCAMTGLDVKLVIMPINQDPSHTERAQKHADWLMGKYPNVSVITIDATDTFAGFKALMTAAGEDGELADVNSRSRLRMMILYYIANANGLMVAGTGNKVEDYGIGFFTKFGDGGVDFSPIGDLTKSQVYKLAEAVGIIEEIRTAPPTDGLWGDTRTDESQIGASYPELEWAMQYYDKHGRDESQLDDDRAKEVLRIYANRHEGCAHKMSMPPVCSIPAELFVSDEVDVPAEANA